MGKGDARRPTQISDKEFTNEWCLTFGHAMRASMEVCINCGRSAQEIAEREAK